MNIDSNTKIKDKKKIFILISLLIVSLITIFLIFLLIFNKRLSSNLEELKDSNEFTANSEESKLHTIMFGDLIGDFTGIRENIDGSIDAVLFEIVKFDNSNNSFDFVLNIGTSMKYKGIGIYSKDGILKSDILGNLYYSRNENNKIILQSPSNKSNSKFKLIKE